MKEYIMDIRQPEKFVTGMNAGYSKNAGYYTSAEFESVIKHATNTNAEWIVLNVSIIQERWFSQSIGFDYRRTAKDHELEYAIELCRKNGHKIMLKPVVLCLDGSWRGMINFLTGDTPPKLIEDIVVDYWPKWFTSYRSAIKRYAETAQRLDIDCFCIGSELLGTQKWKIKEWQRTIEHARQYFKGEITYELAFADCKEYPGISRNDWFDEYRQTDVWEWYNDLDFLSASRKMPSFRAEIVQEKLQPLEALAKKLGKPVLLSNCKVDAVDLNNHEFENVLRSIRQMNFISGCFI